MYPDPTDVVSFDEITGEKWKAWMVSANLRKILAFIAQLASPVRITSKNRHHRALRAGFSLFNTVSAQRLSSSTLEPAIATSKQ